MGSTKYITSMGELSRKDNSLCFRKNGKNIYIPIENTKEIYCLNEVSFNSKLLDFLGRNNIIVHFFNYYDFYISSLVPREAKISGRLLVNQVEHYTDSKKRMELAKEFVKSAGNNIYRNLRYYNGRGKDVKDAMLEIMHLVKEVDKCDNIKQLMGVEGNIHKIYYSKWNVLIDQEIDFTARVKHPPDNMINTLISYLNSLVYTTVLGEIYKTQLNPTISYLHEPGVSRFSLSLDIAEIFKPLIADRMIFSLLNKNQIRENHFTKGLDYLHLSEQGSKIILSEYDKRLKQTIMHKELGREVSYRYLIRLECYKLIKHLYDEKKYDSFVMWW